GGGNHQHGLCSIARRARALGWGGGRRGGRCRRRRDALYGHVGGGGAGTHHLGFAACRLVRRTRDAVRRDGARERRSQRRIAALLLTLAIVSHHFTAMGAVEILPDPTRVIDAFSLSPTALALAITNAAVAVLGMSLAGAFADRRLREKDAQLTTALN